MGKPINLADLDEKIKKSTQGIYSENAFLSEKAFNVYSIKDTKKEKGIVIDPSKFTIEKDNLRSYKTSIYYISAEFIESSSTKSTQSSAIGPKLWDVTIRVEEIGEEKQSSTEEKKEEVKKETSKEQLVYALPFTDKNRLSDTQQKSNAKYIYKYLSNLSWTKESICALLGNVQQECQLNPGVWQLQDNINAGYGIVQWTGGKVFLKWAELNIGQTNSLATNNPKKLLDLQLEFLVYTCTTKNYDDRRWYPTIKHGSPYKMSYNNFICSKLNPGDLALVFHGSYERSSDDNTRKQNRINYANKWYKFF